MSGKGEAKFIGLVKSAGQPSKIEIFPEFCLGLEGLSGFSHVIVLYWFHMRDDNKERATLQVVPRRHPDAPRVGVFASRSPNRPNPIGLCVVELIGIEGCILAVNGLDALEGSPIIDIKPYFARADALPKASAPEWASRGDPT